jgi:hypothetical protein
MSWRAAVASFALLAVSPTPAAAQDATAPAPPGFVREPPWIERAVVFVDRRTGSGEIDGNTLREGYYVDFGNMIPGAGWISAGPGYRRWYGRDFLFVDASAAISWRGYKTAQARFEFPALARSRLAVGSQIRWQDYTQVSYFGEGPESFESNASDYRLTSTNLVGYARLRPVEWLAFGGNIGWLQPDIRSRAGFFERDRPETQDLFASDAVFAQPEQPAFIHSEASVTADTRDFPGHPTRGGLYRAAAANYSDRDSGLFSFRRYELEGAQFISLAGSRLVIALHGWLATSDTSDGNVVPFYLQPSLGGHNSLRSYADYRFHDRNMLLINVEARVPMMTHVDAAVFFDAGNVAPRVGDLNLDKRSVGAGLRLHTRRTTVARVDVARGDEGWRFLVRLTDPLNLARLARRTAAVPFVH